MYWWLKLQDEITSDSIVWGSNIAGCSKDTKILVLQLRSFVEHSIDTKTKTLRLSGKLQL